jgi:hypothetical protein
MADFCRQNALDQALDIAGSFTKSQTRDLSDEPGNLGAPLSGQTGSAATITVGATVQVSGLTGMTATSEGDYLQITGATNPGNNGTFLITNYVDANTVDISNGSAVSEGPGTFTWTERQPYSLEDDLNFERTDRQAIKGTTNYYDAIPTYYRCTDQTTPVPANLTNLAGKTTDTKSLVINRKFENAQINPGDGYYLMSTGGNVFPYADSVDRTGVPINDGADAGNDDATYVDIIDGYNATGLYVLSGQYAGWRIFGRTRQGTSGVDGYSVEVEFRAVQEGFELSSSVAYTWEVGQPTSYIDLYYGYRECLDSMSETALRVVMANGLISDSDLRQDVNDIRTTIGIQDGDTDLSNYLTNLTAYYPFYNLPDATPTVVEALNTLNEQIGDRDYTGSILTDGYTITQSLQELADAISSAGDSWTRIIERLSGDISAGTLHVLPGGASYILDATDNGANMLVFWRGLLRDPGIVANGDDYEETDTTHITPYYKIKKQDHINYFIRTP